jgi:hypothetical protein
VEAEGCFPTFNFFFFLSFKVACVLVGAAGGIVTGEALAMVEHVFLVPIVLDFDKLSHILSPVQAPPIYSCEKSLYLNYVPK